MEGVLCGACLALEATTPSAALPEPLRSLLKAPSGENSVWHWPFPSPPLVTVWTKDGSYVFPILRGFSEKALDYLASIINLVWARVIWGNLKSEVVWNRLACIHVCGHFLDCQSIQAATTFTVTITPPWWESHWLEVGWGETSQVQISQCKLKAATGFSELRASWTGMFLLKTRGITKPVSFSPEWKDHMT